MRWVRCIIVLMGLLVTTGCQRIVMGIVHPHSEPSSPTFCLYAGSNPDAIGQVQVYQVPTESQEKIKELWFLEYVSGSERKHTQLPFSCITYGKTPPGYKQKAPALPLIPEEVYDVRLTSTHAGVATGRFSLHSDSPGSPLKLEYESNQSNIQVITKQ